METGVVRGSGVEKRRANFIAFAATEVEKRSILVRQRGLTLLTWVAIAEVPDRFGHLDDVEDPLTARALDDLEPRAGALKDGGR